MNHFSKTDESLILYKLYSDGIFHAPDYEDMTITQYLFFFHMAQKRVQSDLDFESKINALCESQGVKIKGNSRNSHGRGNNFNPNEYRLRAQARKARKMKNYNPMPKKAV